MHVMVLQLGVKVMLHETIRNDDFRATHCNAVLR